MAVSNLATLSIALRVASFKPNVTLPFSPATISIPDLADSAVVAVPSPDTKCKPVPTATVLVAVSLLAL